MTQDGHNQNLEVPLAKNDSSMGRIQLSDGDEVAIHKIAHEEIKNNKQK